MPPIRMQRQQFERWAFHKVEYGTLEHKPLAIAKPVAVARLALAGLAALSSLLRNKT